MKCQGSWPILLNASCSTSKIPPSQAVWDEDNNLVEMTYCAITGRVLNKKITKARDIKR